MKQFFLILGLFLFVQPVFAQPKSISLDDAVLRQHLGHPTESLRSPQFIPGTSNLTFFTPRHDTLRVAPSSGKAKELTLVSLAEINEILGTNLRYISDPYWLNSNEFHLVDENSVYAIQLKEKKGRLLFRFPEDAVNLDYHPLSKQLAYTIENKLYIANTGDARRVVSRDDQLVSGQSIARQEFGITKGTFWSSNGEVLAYYQKDESYVADYPLLDITNTPGTLVNIKYPMAGQTSEQAFVGVFDSRTGKSLRLKVPGARDQYLTNVVVSPDNKFVLVAVVNRAQNHMRLERYNATTGELDKVLFEEKDERWVEPEQSAWFIPGKSDEFIWLSERDGYMHAYHYNMDGQLIRQVTKGEWTVDEILGMDKDRKTLYVAGYDESGLNRLIYSASMSKDEIKKVSHEAGVHRPILSSDGAVLYDSWSNVEVPLRSLLMSSSGKVIRDLRTGNDPGKKIKLATTELVTIKSADGKTDLQGRIIKPSTMEAGKKYPVLVYVYGGPHAQMVTNSWLAGAPLWMHWLAEEQDYIVFTLDNRGSAHRGRDFEQVIHRQLGTAEVADQMEGVKYLKSLPYVDGERLAIHGWSFGGFMTISMMLRQAGTFNVGVAGGPVTDWKYYEVMYGERYMDTPEENAEGYHKSSLFTYSQNLSAPLMIIHGTIDDVVVMQHSLTLIKQFIEEGIQVDFFPYPMHPHNVHGKDRLHLMTKILGYVLERN